MFAILAAIAFAIAFFENAGVITVHGGWADASGMLYLGLFCLAIHLIRLHGVGNWRSG